MSCSSANIAVNESRIFDLKFTKGFIFRIRKSSTPELDHAII